MLSSTTTMQPGRLAAKVGLHATTPLKTAKVVSADAQVI